MQRENFAAGPDANHAQSWIRIASRGKGYPSESQVKKGFRAPLSSAAA